MTARSDNRPEFQRMIKDAGKEMIDVIIVWKLDRFARNRYDSARYKHILKKHGVKVVSATEPISGDATGILLESMLEGYAEFFSVELAEKVSRGMRENVLKGKYNGGLLPLGYTVDADGYFEVDPITAPVVLDVFKLYDSGLTLKEVAEEMKRRGVRSQRGKAIPPSSITKMLRNRKYIGEYSFKDTVQDGVIPPIVPMDIFLSVQKRLDKNVHAPARFKATDEKYLLSTKLFCGTCGAFMVGESGRSKGGKVFRYYKCATAKRGKGCMRNALRKKDIEDTVVDFIKGVLLDNDLLKRIADMVYGEQKRGRSEVGGADVFLDSSRGQAKALPIL
jgi:DNA invertase Pin-like site-specific DNA recombinase